MGARVYLPGIGRFLQVDPVEGGTDNAYAYPNDPVNDFDLAGTMSFKGHARGIAAGASIASIIPGPVGMVAAGVSCAGYAAAGDKKQALIMSGGIAMAAVGAGGAVVAYKAAKGVKLTSSVAKIARTESKVHGNSLNSMRPTWGYKLNSVDGTFLKNGITSKKVPETRYTKKFMSNKYMKSRLFSNRREAYTWEAKQNKIRRGPLNKNGH